MGASHHDETERKYDVDAGTVFPNLAEAEGVDAVGQPVEHRLEAVYFDTAGLDLARRGVTLRRRTGGTDEGWHLKLPARGDTRTELHEPLGDERAVPESLRMRVRSITRGRAFEPVATVRTTRREYPLHDPTGSVMALATDDSVQAERLGDDREELAWREWEVELVDGTTELLDAVERRLLDAGATTAAVRSKLARVLGEPGAVTSPLESTDADDLTVRQLLGAQVGQHLDRLLEQDAGVRAGHREAVHRVRIAARRLRSALTTFRPLLDTTVTDPVREELRWLGEEFARARDAQVLREHLHDVLAAEPPELVVGSVQTRLDEELGAAYADGREAAERALDSDRYVRLLDCLEELVASPPLLTDGDQVARRVMPDLLARDVKRLRRAVDDIEAAGDPAERNLAFHEARKKAKRLRYAAESAEPVLRKRARSLASDTKRIQEILGIHQDTVVARQRLRELGMQAHLAGENAFTFGRLHALEQARADRAEADFAALWKTFAKKQVRRWVR